MRSTATTGYTIPAIHALHLGQLVARYGGDSKAFFAELGLDEVALAEPSGRIDIRVVQAAVRRAREISGEAGLGFQLGMQMQASTHGYLGFAAMTAPTVGDALDLAIRYVPTRTNALTFRLDVSDGEASLVMEELCDLGDARDVILLAIGVGIWQVGNGITGTRLQGNLELAMPQPAYFKRYARFAPGLVSFGRPQHRFTAKAEILSLPLTMADPASQQLAQAQLNRQLEDLGETSMLAATRAAAELPEGGFRTVEEAARELHLSKRTLKRRLHEEGTHYSAILDSIKSERAHNLLRSPQLGIDEIAHRLGYSDAANFTRAFRRWNGQTPGAFRKALRDAE